MKQRKKKEEKYVTTVTATNTSRVKYTEWDVSDREAKIRLIPSIVVDSARDHDTTKTRFTIRRLIHTKTQPVSVLCCCVPLLLLLFCFSSCLFRCWLLLLHYFELSLLCFALSLSLSLFLTLSNIQLSKCHSLFHSTLSLFHSLSPSARSSAILAHCSDWALSIHSRIIGYRFHTIRPIIRPEKNNDKGRTNIT